MKLYGGHLLDKSVLLDEIQQHRQQHEKALAIMLDIEKQYSQLESGERNKLALPFLTLRRGILGEQAWLTWAQEVENFLQE